MRINAIRAWEQSDYENEDAVNRIKTFQQEICSKSFEFSIERLMREAKLVTLREQEKKHRDE